MGPNKIEKQFREKLSSREIQPSAQAWDRLDAMLSVAEEKKTKRSPFLSFQFIGIAAGILVLLTVGMFLFNQKSTNIEPQNNVVGTDTKKDTVQNPEKSSPSPIIEQKQENQVVINQFQSSPEAQPNSLERSGQNQKTTVNQKTNENQIIKDKVIEFQNSTDVALKDLPKIEKRKEIIIENKKDINIKSDAVLVADLDKTSKQASNQKSTVKVDAKSLLSQVDGEVECTFRERVLNKMNKNYKEIKVALTNRNNE
jgi:hypothetical protein